MMAYDTSSHHFVEEMRFQYQGRLRPEAWHLRKEVTDGVGPMP